MIDLSKGLSLFISGAPNDWTASGLISFLSNDYTFLSVSFGKDKFGIASDMAQLSVDITNYQDKIKENLFRVEALVVYIPYDISKYSELLKFLSELNLITFIVVPKLSQSLQEDSEKVNIIRNFYFIKSNPNSNRFTTPQQLAGINVGELSDRYKIVNIGTEEEFTLNQYKKMYIRDKKIDHYLKNDDGDFNL
jgi:hypothetical protein